MKRLYATSVVVALMGLGFVEPAWSQPHGPNGTPHEPHATSNGGRFVAFLSGDEEVPPVETEANGLASISITRAGHAIRFRLLTQGLEEIIQAHIHVGPAGENGPPVVFLFDSMGEPVTVDGLLSTGMFTADDLIGPLAGQPLSSLIEAIQNGNTYVNVHTSAFPGGEIRGQLGRVGRRKNNDRGGGLPRKQVWAHCELFGTVVTPAHFSGEHGLFDELYMMPEGAGFRDGVGLISDAAPGDGAYNGGRWHVNVLRDGVDPSTYSDTCSADDLSPDDFESTDQYFECPLQPRRRHGRP